MRLFYLSCIFFLNLLVHSVELLISYYLNGLHWQFPTDTYNWIDEILFAADDTLCLFSDSDFNWSVYKVSAGKRSLYEVEESEMIYDIDNVFFHPNYTKGTLDNDVAIVKLRQKIAYTDAIRPVCRAEPRDEPPTNSVCVTTGWLHRSGKSQFGHFMESIVIYSRDNVRPFNFNALRYNVV